MSTLESYHLCAKQEAGEQKVERGAYRNLFVGNRKSVGQQSNQRNWKDAATLQGR